MNFFVQFSFQFFVQFFQIFSKITFWAHRVHQILLYHVRKVIKTSNTKSLWQAVNASKDTSNYILPKTLDDLGMEIHDDEVADAFASFFDTNVKTLLDEVSVDDNSGDKFFKTEPNTRVCMKPLKT
jgi:hypothetical protein